MLVLRNLLWYMDQKRNILISLIIWAILGRLHAECCLIFTHLLDAIQHPVFISLVRLSSGKHGWNNTTTTMKVSLGHSYILVIYQPILISKWYWHYSQIYLQLLWSRYIFRCFTWSLNSTPVVKYTKHVFKHLRLQFLWLNNM